MATLGIDGLVSGLDTTSLINSLMQLEAAPQAVLKQKSSTAQSLVSALQALNVKVASLAENAAAAAKATSWDAYRATSSSSAVTATTTAGAQAGSLSFSVDSVATARVAVSAQVRDDGSLVTGMPPAVTVRTADGRLVTVEPTSGSLADIADALNAAADAGVKVTVVRVTNGETPMYRLQFTGTTTGSAGNFKVFAGTAEEVAAGTAPRLDTTLVHAATDATVTLWKGVPGLERSFTQSSNTFSGLITGVDVTVAKVTEPDETVTVTVARDEAALKNLAKNLVSGLGVVLSEIASRTAVTSTTGADGKTSVTGGLFTGDTAVRSLQQRLVEAASYPVDGTSPSSVGIVLGRDGTFTFDEAAFSAALAADPAKVQAVVAGLAQRVADVATATSDKHEGTLTLRIQSQESLVKDLGDQIDSWDRRLELRRAALERTYATLETTLSRLTSQSTWLASQLASLPTWSTSK